MYLSLGFDSDILEITAIYFKVSYGQKHFTPKYQYRPPQLKSNMFKYKVQVQAAASSPPRPAEPPAAWPW